jgi:outer membrane protein assembly factor BamE (lipoprotein component of BamABCDE complex)
MKKIFLLLIISLTLTSCNIKKVEKHHGVHFLDKKQVQLVVNKSNTNDIISLLGSPSTKSTFDNDLWIYIERKIDHSLIAKSLGQENLIVNNVLVLEVSNKGILKRKEFHNLNSMKKIKFVERGVASEYKKTKFIYDFLSSVRQKINDPLGKRQRN